MRQYPKPQEIYRHFKGNVYQIVTLARHSENGERMVVYQQMYAPYEVYVRPLEMFMSKVDVNKYPNEKQKYRFEKVEIHDEAKTQKEDVLVNNIENNIENKIESLEKADNKRNGNDEIYPESINTHLIDFLDADSYERKLEILRMLNATITDDMIDTMAVSLDTEIKAGDVQQRYDELKNYLITMERFECNRLR